MDVTAFPGKVKAFAGTETQKDQVLDCLPVSFIYFCKKNHKGARLFKLLKLLF